MMKVLRVRSVSVHRALEEARRQLGAEPTILYTKEFEEPKWFGIRRSRAVELLAAVDAPGRRAQSTNAARSPVPEGAPGDVTGDAQVTRELSEMRTLLARIDRRIQSPSQEDLPAAARRLIRNGVSEKLAKALVGGEDTSMAEVLDGLRARIQCSGPIDMTRGQARVALVGPTGAGKTTTIAKLASQYSLLHSSKVALITLDTYRVGAVEQLGTYARILNIPLEAALEPEDVAPLIEKHADKDLILIDTVGRSQRNRQDIAQLWSMLEPARPTEVHLAVSASSSIAVQHETIVSFSRLGTNRLLLTKLDECAQTGCIVELAMAALLPFSYVTIGQEVPDDLMLADSQRLAEAVWQGRL
ncbi:MAG: flagellar biosynthesis protein FlhF [Armatimonadota bacterium]